MFVLCTNLAQVALRCSGQVLLAWFSYKVRCHVDQTNDLVHSLLLGLFLPQNFVLNIGYQGDACTNGDVACAHSWLQGKIALGPVTIQVNVVLLLFA